MTRYSKLLMSVTLSGIFLLSCGQKKKREYADFLPVYGADETVSGDKAEKEAEEDEEEEEEEPEKDEDEGDKGKDADGEDKGEKDEEPKNPALNDNTPIYPPANGGTDPIGNTNNPLLPPIDSDYPLPPVEPPPIFDEDIIVGDRLFPRFGPTFSVCGNGKREPLEQCDDGNDDNTDGCNILCRFPYCGNGVREKNEWCDDGNNVSGDGCSKVCEYEICGNGVLDNKSESEVNREECDDGNTENGDGCSACCKKECGTSITTC